MFVLPIEMSFETLPVLLSMISYHTRETALIHEFEKQAVLGLLVPGLSKSIRFSQFGGRFQKTVVFYKKMKISSRVIDYFQKVVEIEND